MVVNFWLCCSRQYYFLSAMFTEEFRETKLEILLITEIY